MSFVGLVEYTKRDLILYAFGIGCDVNERCFLYEHDTSFSAFPLFPLTLPFRAVRTNESVSPNLRSLDQDYASLGMFSFPPPMMREERSSSGIIHLAQKYRLHDSNVPLGTNKIELITRIIHNKKNKRGTIVVNETLFYVLPDSSSKQEEKWLLATSQTTSLYLSSLSDNDLCEIHHPSQTLRPISNNTINPSEKPDAIEIIHLNETQAMLYRLSGDTNRIHVEGSSLFQNNSTKPVLHGLCTLGYAVRAILKLYGGIFQYVDCKFTNPVFVGDTISVHMWKGQKWDDSSMMFIGFQVKRSDEKDTTTVVIDDGIVQLKTRTFQNRDCENRSKL